MKRVKKEKCNLTINAYKVLYPPRGKTRSQMIDQLCCDIKSQLGYDRIVEDERKGALSADLAKHFGISEKEKQEIIRQRKPSKVEGRNYYRGKVKKE